MRRLLMLVVTGGLAWWFLGRRSTRKRRSATIGYADGSSVTLEHCSPELDRLVRIASQTTSA